MNRPVVLGPGARARGPVSLVRLAALAMTCLAAVAPRPAAADYTYSLYQAPGAQGTTFWELNNAGTIVGAVNANNGEGLIYAGGQFTFVPGPTGTLYTEFNDINNAGVIVGDSVTPDFSHDNGFYLNPDGTFKTPAFAKDPSVAISALVGINDLGTAVGVYSSDITMKNALGFVLDSQGHLTTYAHGTDPVTWLFKINNRGDIVGQSFDATRHVHSFALMGGLGGTEETIAVPGASATWVEGINNLGDMTGFYSTDGTNRFGFLLHDGVYTTFDYSGLGTIRLNGINDSGEMVGTVNEYTPQAEGIVIRSVPEPSSLVLMAAGTGGLVLGIRRRRARVKRTA